MVVCKTSLIFSYIPLISHECRFLLLGYQLEFLEVTRVLLSPHLWKTSLPLCWRRMGYGLRVV